MVLYLPLQPSVLIFRWLLSLAGAQEVLPAPGADGVAGIFGTALTV